LGPERATAPAIQVGRSGTRLGDPGALRSAREAFAARHLVRLHDFLDADLVAFIRRALDRADWVVRVHDALDPPAIDLGITDRSLLGLLVFLLNDRRLFDAIRAMTGVRDIEFFHPAIYKMIPGQGHRDTWHDDVDGNRLIAMSINLSAEPYAGGVLRVRRKGATDPVESIQNTGPGDALLFRVDDTLEHCLTEVVGSAPKVTLVGWFQRRPMYSAVMRQAW
jgi:hypothetical protein